MGAAREGPVGWRVLLRFAAILIALNLAYYAEKKLGGAVVDEPYTHAVTWTSAQVARAVLPYSVQSSGRGIVAGGRHSLFIASGCNGLEAIFLMLAAIAAYPATWRRRLRGLAWYLPALFALNLVRVVALVHVAHSHHDLMDVAHYQVAQGILILFVLAFWVHYLRGVDG